MNESLKLQRHLLGSIDLSDIEEKELSESERKAYCAAIFAAFPRLEKDIKKLQYEQLVFQANTAENWEQVLFGRGTFNGLDLILDLWRRASNEHIASAKGNQETFNKINPISEI